MRVLLVTDTIHAGGAETFVLRLADKLGKAGMPAHILCLNPDIEDQALIGQYPHLTIHRIRLPLLIWIKRLDRFLRMAGIDFTLQYWLTGKVMARKYLQGYEVYHTHLISVDLLLARLKRAHPGIRIVSTLHGDYNEYEMFWQTDSPHKRLNWPRKVALLTGQVDAWAWISRHQEELFAGSYGVPARKLHHIYNGYEPAAPLPPPAPKGTGEGLRFIMVARGIPLKGWAFLIKAFRQIPGPHKLVLVGKGEHLDVLRAAHADDTRIRFAGFHPAPAQLIGEADVFVFPSIYPTESLPTVIIEALYCGVPVISTDIGEVAPMLATPDGRRAGVLIDQSGGREEAIIPQLVAAMRAYIGDRGLLRQHAALTGPAFDKFRMDACAARYQALYRLQNSPET